MIERWEILYHGLEQPKKENNFKWWQMTWSTVRKPSQHHYPYKNVLKSTIPQKV